MDIIMSNFFLPTTKLWNNCNILVWNKFFFMDNWFRWKYCFGFI